MATTPTTGALTSPAANGSDHGGHEITDVSFGGVVAFGIGLVIATAIVLALTWLLLAHFAARAVRGDTIQYPLGVAGSERLPPEPRLQIHPRQDLLDLRLAEEAELHSYGWVDKNAGIVRIPIDEAIRLTLERGLPSRPPAATGKQ